MSSSVISSKYGRPKRITRSIRAGLQFPVGRINRYLHKSHFAKRISENAAIYLTATLEYLVTELIEMAGFSAKKNKRKRITPRDIQLVIRTDEELQRMLNNVIIVGGGVVPNIIQELRSCSKSKGAKSREY